MRNEPQVYCFSFIERLFGKKGKQQKETFLLCENKFPGKWKPVGTRVYPAESPIQILQEAVFAKTGITVSVPEQSVVWVHHFLDGANLPRTYLYFTSEWKHGEFSSREYIGEWFPEPWLQKMTMKDMRSPQHFAALRRYIDGMRGSLSELDL